jgi:DNA processing protein
VKGKGGPAHAAPREPAGLSEQEGAVLKLIPADGPAHIDALAERSGLPVQELSGLLLALEMRDLVRQLPGRCYVRRL